MVYQLILIVEVYMHKIIQRLSRLTARTPVKYISIFTRLVVFEVTGQISKKVPMVIKKKVSIVCGLLQILPNSSVGTTWTG